MGRENKKILTPDMFEVGAGGELIIKDLEMAEMVKQASRQENVGEQGVGVAVSVDIV